VFEIGSSLREARLRQGLGFPEIEQATKVRTKHLKALEDEQFELLPGQTYVKGFLRTYAEYLGLDGQLYVDEFNSRYAAGEEEATPIARRSVSSGGRRRIEARPVVLAVLGIAAVTALVIVAGISGGGDNPTNTPTPRVPSTTQRSTPERPVKKKQKKEKPPAPARVRLVVTADQGGASWIEAHAGSATGRQLYEGTLESGQTLPLPRKGKLKRIWMNVGQPAELSWRLNGKDRPPPGVETGFFLVTAKGISTAPAA
jgi:cytoskeletal protein RodZ